MTQSPLRSQRIKPLLLATLFPACLFLTLTPLSHVFQTANFGEDSLADAEKVCVIEEPALTESSGMAISRQHELCLWIHNDSGDVARLFLIGVNGRTRAIITLKDVDPMDWEDMCSFELDGEKWLLIGDVGDNGRVRGKSAPICKLHLLKEPKVTLELASRIEPCHEVADVISTTEFSLPEGPQDCESLAVDTQRREVLLLTKSDPAACRLFRLPLTLQPGVQKAQAEIVAAIGIPWATAMDVSADGRKLVAVNMFSGVLFERTESESWNDACLRPGSVLAMPPRLQGESVCFESTGESLLLNSERQNQPLWRVRLPRPVHP